MGYPRRMKRLALGVLVLVIAACGDNNKGAAVDASVDSLPVDMGTIDTPIDAEIDAAIDAPPSSGIQEVRDATNGAVDIDIVDATVTYLKPAVAGANTTNDPAGFTVQVNATGPGLFVAVDPATTTPALAVGDVISFTVTMKAAPGNSPRATAISDLTRSSTGADVNALVQDVTAATDLVSAIGNYDHEIVDITAATLASSSDTSGAAYNRFHITTTGIDTLDTNFQLRMPEAFRTELDLEMGCVVAINNAPVGRFNTQAQIGVWSTSDITVTSCPAPTVSGATATSATTVTVTFSRNIDTATLLADGSQFTIVDDTTPTPVALPVTAAVLTAPRTVTLTTAAQVPGEAYTVTVANTLEDTVGTALAAPLAADFTGFATPIPSVMMAAAPAATTVTVTFTRDIDMATVTADGSQFSIVETTTPANTLTVTAASVSGMVVTLTTAAQTPGMMYTVTVANTVEDTDGTAVGAPLSASFLGFTPAAAVDHLVINEIDYDQPGTDEAEFVEIYNPTANPIDLSAYALVFISPTGGNPAPNGNEYLRIALSGMLPAGGYAVVGMPAVLSAITADIEIPLGSVAIQNGSPDGVALVNPTTFEVIDALSYEGAITNTTPSGFPAPVSLVEGAMLPTTVFDDAANSLQRFPNGADTNQAANDWALRAPTPGAAN